MTGQHPSEPRTAAGRRYLRETEVFPDEPDRWTEPGAAIRAIEDEALAVRRAHYPDIEEAGAQRDRRPEHGDYRYKPGSDLDVAHAFGFREGYELAEKRAVAQRDRLRAAPSVEELAKALHAADIAMLSGEGRPSDYIRWAEQVRAALTDDPEGET